MLEDRNEPWFIHRCLGRFEVVHWRGAVAFLGLMLVLITGGWVEGALKSDHPVLTVIIMVPLAALAIGLVALIDGRARWRK